MRSAPLTRHLSFWAPIIKLSSKPLTTRRSPGVSCFLSRAKKGGIKGTLGLAEDTSDASLACRQTGPVTLPDDLEEGEQVFRQRTSLLFKTMQVVRFYDEERNTLIYLTYSDKIVDGSPKNAISAVVIRPWAR